MRLLFTLSNAHAIKQTGLFLACYWLSIVQKRWCGKFSPALKWQNERVIAANFVLQVLSQDTDHHSLSHPASQQHTPAACPLGCLFPQKIHLLTSLPQHKAINNISAPVGTSPTVRGCKQFLPGNLQLPEATNPSQSLSVILSPVPSCSSIMFTKNLLTRKEENYGGRMVNFREI